MSTRCRPVASTLLFVGVVAFLALSSLAWPPLGLAQSLPGLPATAAQESNEPAAEPTPAPHERATPRATMETFLVAMSGRRWKEAIATLDLRGENFSADVIAARGRDLATELKAVIDRVAYVQLEEIPEAEWDRSWYVWRTVEGHPIALERVGEGEWLFSRETIERLPELWESPRRRCT